MGRDGCVNNLVRLWCWQASGQTCGMPSVVSACRVVDASAQQIFDLLADPAMHPLLDGSGSVKASRGGNPDRLSEGATFGMDMRIGVSYQITNTVVEFDEPRLIAWRHFNGHVWRYRLDPVDDTHTMVTEEWDPAHAGGRLTLRLLRFPARNRRGIEATLRRLVGRFAG